MLVEGMIGALISAIGFAMMLDTPKKYLPHVGLVGIIGGAIYLLSVQMSLGNVAASFLSAFSVSLVSQILARVVKTPVSIFLIAGIFPTVPGAGMYRIVHYVIAGDNSMASYYFFETLKVAGVIALGIFFADAIFRIFTKKKSIFQRRELT